MTRISIALSVFFVTVLAACGGGQRVDPILQLSTPEALVQGKALMEEKKYLRAQRYFDHAFEASPNSREGRDALLLSADALYLAGGTDNFIRCEAKYRDFLNRFPTSERSDYAQYQVANCLAERVEKPDRDQNATRKSLAAYQEMFRLYPTSPFTEEARAKVTQVRHNLAESEYMVGEFYTRFRLCQAAIERLEVLPERYPEYDKLDRVHFHLGRAYLACGLNDKADAAFASLRQDFPDSPMVKEIEGARKSAKKDRKENERRKAKADARRQKG